MKTASFKATIFSPCGTKSASAYGKVTLKTDGKVSISIDCRNQLPYRLRSLATKVANEIVESNFNHPAIIGEVQSTDTGILGLLTKETAQLKVELMNKTNEYATTSFAFCQESLPVVSTQLDAIAKTYYTARRNGESASYMMSEYKSLRSKFERMSNIVSGGLEKYVADQLKNAESHYTSSLSKLAMKIMQKGMDMTNFTLVSGYVGINLEMKMTDGVKTIKAWTIWAAEGSTLVSPHYRYLVK
jgi:hypothetical protein